MKRFAKAGVLSLAALMLTAASPATTPLSRDNTPWWHARHEEKLARIRQGHVDLLFLGDSIMQNWEQHGPPDWKNFAPSWEHYYGDRNAVNLGFKGDTTASLLWRIQHGEVDGIHPKAAVILIGANNNGYMHASADQTLDGIAAIIAELHRRLPETKLLLLSVLPSVRSAWVDQTTLAINRGLAERYAHASGITYQDVTDLFMRDGKLDRDAFLDGHLTPPDPLLHPTAQTQARLSAAIEPTVAQMMGDRVHDSP